MDLGQPLDIGAKLNQGLCNCGVFYKTDILTRLFLTS